MSCSKGGGGVQHEFADKIGFKSQNLPTRYPIMVKDALVLKQYFLSGVCHHSPLAPTVTRVLMKAFQIQLGS